MGRDEIHAGESPAGERAAAVRPKPRRVTFKLLALGLGAVVAAIIAEAGLRVAGAGPLRLDEDWHARHKALYRLRPEGDALPYDLQPGAQTTFAYRGPEAEYRINEDGIRADRRYGRPRP